MESAYKVICNKHGYSLSARDHLNAIGIYAIRAIKTDGSDVASVGLWNVANVNSMKTYHMKCLTSNG